MICVYRVPHEKDLEGNKARGGERGHAMEQLMETRWLILTTDGHHVTLGRHRDPEPEDIEKAEQALLEQSRSGWLVLMKGAYYARTKPQLMIVRAMGEPGDAWEKAVDGFAAHWRKANCCETKPSNSEPSP